MAKNDKIDDADDNVDSWMIMTVMIMIMMNNKSDDYDSSDDDCGREYSCHIPPRDCRIQNTFWVKQNMLVFLYEVCQQSKDPSKNNTQTPLKILLSSH